MGVSPSSTLNKSIPNYPAKIWNFKNIPQGKNLLLGKKVQSESFYTYNPECHACNGNGCDSGKCSTFTSWDSCGNKGNNKMTNAFGETYTPAGTDFIWTTDSCIFTCPNKPICTLPNINECLLGPGLSGEDPTFKVDWDNNDTIQCTFDLEKINDVNQIFLYKQKFNPDNNDTEYYKLMGNFCSVQSNDCSIDPISQQKIKQCSRTSAAGTDQNSQICRQWFNGLNQQNRDTYVGYICSTYPNNTECTCNNRLSDPIYNNIKKSLNFDGIEDACVYLPCKGGTPSYLLNWFDSHPTCPTTVCQTIFNVNDTTGNVIIDDNQIYISCPLPDKPDSPTNKPINNYIPWDDLTVAYVPKNQENIKRNKIIGYFLILSIFLILILIFFKF